MSYHKSLDGCFKSQYRFIENTICDEEKKTITFIGKIDHSNTLNMIE